MGETSFNFREILYESNKMVLTSGQVLDPSSGANPGEFNPEIPMRFAFGINSTIKFFCTAFEKFSLIDLINYRDYKFCFSKSHRVFFLVPHTRIEHKMIIIKSMMPRIFRITGAFAGSNAIRPYTRPINGKRIPETGDQTG